MQAHREESATPKYLYKIISLQDWQQSQGKSTLVLPASDEAFVHFSTEDQLDRILSKYWADAPGYVVLKVETAKLQGKMVYEINPGGSSKYYHLYDGCIPKDAVVESRVYRQF